MCKKKGMRSFGVSGWWTPEIAQTENRCVGKDKEAGAN